MTGKRLTTIIFSSVIKSLNVFFKLYISVNKVCCKTKVCISCNDILETYFETTLPWSAVSVNYNHLG